MTNSIFNPTLQQVAVVESDTPLFVRACPGAGKTRILVERARKIVSASKMQRGVAFLSFTRAAVWELENRLRADDLQAALTFPNFVGTFDSFIWQFLLMPFGAPGCSVKPKLIADKEKWPIQPFSGAQALPLQCFDRASGAMIVEEAKKNGFDQATRPAGQVLMYETSTNKILANALSKGHLDFTDVRRIVRDRLLDHNFTRKIGPVLQTRFAEIVVDEAQDCNPADLEIITWLRQAGIVSKVVCDPEQAIYGFRGGVGAELDNFEATFEAGHRKILTGNFRSTPAICNAVSALRRGTALPDEPLGQHKHNTIPVHLLTYTGGVSLKIGECFQTLLASLGLQPAGCPILAATIDSACKAVGQPPPSNSTRMSVRLAEAVMSFQFARSSQHRKAALDGIHEIVLTLEGKLEHISYKQYVADLEGGSSYWNARILPIIRQLEFKDGETSTAWITKARSVLGVFVVGTRTISQLLVNADIDGSLVVPSATSSPARTIHSVKGLELPGVCVIMTTSTAKGIIDFLEAGTATDKAEEARKIYVAASRAEQLLCIAVPNSQAMRLKGVLEAKATPVQVHNV